MSFSLGKETTLEKIFTEIAVETNAFVEVEATQTYVKGEAQSDGEDILVQDEYWSITYSRTKTQEEISGIRDCIENDADKNEYRRGLSIIQEGKHLTLKLDLPSDESTGTQYLLALREKSYGLSPVQNTLSSLIEQGTEEQHIAFPLQENEVAHDALKALFSVIFAVATSSTLQTTN